MEAFLQRYSSICLPYYMRETSEVGNWLLEPHRRGEVRNYEPSSLPTEQWDRGQTGGKSCMVKRDGQSGIQVDRQKEPLSGQAEQRTV